MGHIQSDISFQISELVAFMHLCGGRNGWDYPIAANSEGNVEKRDPGPFCDEF